MVTVGKDIYYPEITIHSPSDLESCGLPPEFNISITEGNLYKTWYRLYTNTQGWTMNISFTGTTGTIDSVLWFTLPDCDVVIRFYANDTAGNLAYKDVFIVKDLSQYITATKHTIATKDTFIDSAFPSSNYGNFNALEE